MLETTLEESKMPFTPIDYRLELSHMQAQAGPFKIILGWYSLFAAILAIFFNTLVLSLVLKRLKLRYNLDMMLVTVILSIDLVYCLFTILMQLIMICTDFGIYNYSIFTQFTGLVLPLLTLGSLYMVAVLSFERYLFTVKGIRWTPWSFYSLAIGYIAPSVILGVAGAVTGQFIPMPSMSYSLVRVDRSTFGGIYIGFFTIQSILSGLVFNLSYLSILFYHRDRILKKSELERDLEAANFKPVLPQTSSSNDPSSGELLSLPAMLEAPMPNLFTLRTKSRAKTLANTLMFKTLSIVILYNIICLPEILALCYETFTLHSRAVEWDFIAALAISNHALVSPLIVLFLHQQTREDWDLYRTTVTHKVKTFFRGNYERSLPKYPIVDPAKLKIGKKATTKSELKHQNTLVFQNIQDKQSTSGSSDYGRSSQHEHMDCVTLANEPSSSSQVSVHDQSSNLNYEQIEKDKITYRVPT